MTSTIKKSMLNTLLNKNSSHINHLFGHINQNKDGQICIGLNLDIFFTFLLVENIIFDRLSINTLSNLSKKILTASMPYNQIDLDLYQRMMLMEMYPEFYNSWKSLPYR